MNIVNNLFGNMWFAGRGEKITDADKYDLMHNAAYGGHHTNNSFFRIF